MKKFTDPIEERVATFVNTFHRLVKNAVLEALRAWDQEAAQEAEAASTARDAPLKQYDVNYNQVLTFAIAEDGPAYSLTIAGNPIAEYLPEGYAVVLRHRSEPDRIGVVAWVGNPATYQSNGVVHFLNSNQTEPTDEGQRAQLARLERRHRG